MFPKPAIEALRGSAKVLAQGQSEAHRDSELHNTILEVPAKLILKKLVTVLSQ